MRHEEPIIKAIYRYPVKGLSPERLDRTCLTAGATIAGDRQYAIENGSSGFQPAMPTHLPKTCFLMLMKQARLAELRTRFDEASHTLCMSLAGREVARGELRTAAGRLAIEQFIARHFAEELRGPPRIVSAPGHSFSDVAGKVVSIINLASVAAIAQAAAAPVDPTRFRGNIYIGGWPAWHEFDLVGRELCAGPSARLRVTKRIARCAATEVNPEQGTRDLAVLDTLYRAFGHTNCGVYSEVVAGGEIAMGAGVRADG